MNNANQLNTINLTSKNSGDVWVRWFLVPESPQSQRVNYVSAANCGDPMRVHVDHLTEWVCDVWGHYDNDWRKRAIIEVMFDDHRVTINAGEFLDGPPGSFDLALETIQRSK